MNLTSEMTPEQKRCPHPTDRLLWYDECLHCYKCKYTWMDGRGAPTHAGTPKPWGRPDEITEPKLHLEKRIAELEKK